MKLEQLEKQVVQNTADTEVVFNALRQLLREEKNEDRATIGYRNA